ncbi:MAG: hypothetical protein QM754_10245 [Tepidisphaeraceae bacterium]
MDDQKVLKVDDGAVLPLDPRHERDIAEQLLAAAEGAVCVIFADFGYGLITPGLIDRVMPRLRATVPTDRRRCQRQTDEPPSLPWRRSALPHRTRTA